MKRLLYVFVLAFILSFIAKSQDIILNVSAVLNGISTPLDSVLIENVSNETRFVLKNLPELESYPINLSKQALDNSNFNIGIQGNHPCKVKCNMPGIFSLAYNPDLVKKFTLLSMLGFKLKQIDGSVLSNSDEITLYLKGAEIYIVTVETKYTRFSYRALGSIHNPCIKTELSGSINHPIVDYKSTQIVSEDIKIGDSLNVRVYKADYYIEAKPLKLQANNPIQFVVDPTQGIVLDYEKNEYRTILIGSQWWLAGNMQSSHYANGDVIPLISDNGTWASLYDYNNHWGCCMYENSFINRSEYGYLYTFGAAVKGETFNGADYVQGVCPSGWHIPSDEDWIRLEMFLGMPEGDAIAIGERGGDASVGFKLMSKDGWYMKGNGYNQTNFNAKPGGIRGFGVGDFALKTFTGYWWTSSQASNTYGIARKMHHHYASVNRLYLEKSNGLSVRCVKD